MENLQYIEIRDRKLFVHEHIPCNSNNKACIFLNPIFDEKKRSQKFYADTARSICLKGYHVFRFDYYGTDDSEGQLYEFDLETSLRDLTELHDLLKSRFNPGNIEILGIRLGADLALHYSINPKNEIKKLHLIEPIVNGKRYLTEQRSRRKMFFKLNNMTEVREIIEINGKEYEDHQGYPMSRENVIFLNNLDSLFFIPENKNISLIKLNTVSSVKLMAKLNEKLEEKNKLNSFNFKVDDFWASLEPTNTSALTKEIVDKCFN